MFTSLNHRTRRLALAAIVGLAGTRIAAADPTQQDLLKQVEQLEAKVQQLQANQQKYDTRDVDATVAAVLKDANSHSLLIDGTGVTAGASIKKGFFLGSEDGSFYLHPALMFQFRGVSNYLQAGKNGASDTKTGFEVRRAKFGFDGNVLSKDLQFLFLWQDANNGGTPALQYGWVQYTFTHDFAGGDAGVRAGQFKNITFKEEFTSDTQQLFTERSLANALLGGVALGSEIQGVDFLYGGDKNPLHAQLLIEDGANTSNTDFQNTLTTTTGTPPVTTTNHIDFGVAGRVDYKVFGNWGDANDLTGVWSKDNLLVIGGGADFTQSDHTNAVRFTVDAQYEVAHKFVLFAAGYGDYIDFRNVATATNRKDYGAQVEGGYFVTPAFELIGRYSYVKVDSDFKVAGVDTFHEIAAGFNYFLGDQGSLGNRAKITVDLNYLPNGAPAALGLDYRASTAKKDEVVLRTQLQLAL